MEYRYASKSVTHLLTQNQIGIVDEEDADLVNVKWYAAFNATYGNGGRYAVQRNYTVNGKRCTLFIHRLILSRMLGRELTASEQVDHINQDTLDNRRCNLRLATNSQNAANTGRRNGKSGYKGVVWHVKMEKWCASIYSEGKRLYLGLYDTPQEAHEAYCKKAKEIRGEFARCE